MNTHTKERQITKFLIFIISLLQLHIHFIADKLINISIHHTEKKNSLKKCSQHPIGKPLSKMCKIIDKTTLPILTLTQTKMYSEISKALEESTIVCLRYDL